MPPGCPLGIEGSRQHDARRRSATRSERNWVKRASFKRTYVEAMPERLDRVTIALNGGGVVISWASREALLQRL